MPRYISIFILILLVACSVAPVAPTSTLPPPSLSPVTPTELPSPTQTAVPLAPTATLEPSPTPGPVIERVLVISVDGMRPDAMVLAPMPNLLALLQNSAYSLVAQTIFPSATLPAHTSMLTGLCPSRHGVDWNDYLPERGYAAVDSVFSLAHQAGLKTVMIVGKQKLSQITRPETLDVYRFINDRDTVIAADAAPLLAEGFDFAFVHFPTPDWMGHEYGWLSDEQLSVLRRADEALEVILSALDSAGLRDTTLIIISADHGGHAQMHGSRLPEDMTIPWIISGPGVIPQVLSAPVSTTDTAATVLWALSIPDFGLDGRPVLEAFGQQSLPAAEPRCP